MTRGAEFGRNHAWPEDCSRPCSPTAPSLEPLPPSLLEKGVAAVTAADTRWARRDIKSTALLANILLKKLGADAGAFETIMLENGQLTEGSSTTVHVVKDGAIHTPPNGHHILPGTTRDVVTELADRLSVLPRKQLPSPKRALRGADEIWLAFSTRGVLPVTTLDGAPRRQRRPRPAVQAHVRWRSPTTSASSPGRRRYERHATPLEFPSDFPIKVMGRHDSDLRALTQAIIERHAGPIAESQVQHPHQRGRQFPGVDLYRARHAAASSSTQIYRELTACKSVLMALVDRGARSSPRCRSKCGVKSRATASDDRAPTPKSASRVTRESSVARTH